jgi:hypothetical protein
MTAVAACGSRPLTSGDVTDTHTPHRNVRVADDRWNPFGFAVGARNRSSWLNEFIEWVVADPQLWHEVRAITAKRGEQVEDVVLAALRRYVARHRDLLDDDRAAQ